MKLPKEVGSLKDLKRREANAFSRSVHWHDQLDDAYEYFLPNRNLFDMTNASIKHKQRLRTLFRLPTNHDVVILDYTLFFVYGK